MRCAECGKVASDQAEGWRAFLGGWGTETEVVVFCPGCAEREFGSRDENGLNSLNEIAHEDE
jgi:hypothetical protein